MKTVFATKKTLLFKIKNHQDQNSWDEFVLYYRRYIYMVARNMNLSHHDAEDITQRTLMTLWQKIPDFNYDCSKGSFRSWLCTIIRNMVINFVKRKSRMLTCLDGDEKQATIDYLSDLAIPEVEIIAEKEWQLFILNCAWNNIKDSLTHKVREAYVMLNKGLSLEAVAEKLSIQVNTVYVYRLRVQEKIRKEIKALEDKLN